MTDREELQRLEKLAKERIEQAESKNLVRKAEIILDMFGVEKKERIFYKGGFFKRGFFQDFSTGIFVATIDDLTIRRTRGSSYEKEGKGVLDDTYAEPNYCVLQGERVVFETETETEYHFPPKYGGRGGNSADGWDFTERSPYQTAKRVIGLYIPGEWERQFEDVYREVYKKINQPSEEEGKRMEKKAKDLKDNFGI